MIKSGLLTEEDVIWLNNICQVSHYYVETEMAKLELDLEAAVKQQPATPTPPLVQKPPKRHPRRKVKLSRKERRRFEEEERLYGGVERIGEAGGHGSRGAEGQR